MSSTLFSVILKSIRNKVAMMERRFKTPVDANGVEEEVKPIVIVSCNGSDGKLVECLRKYENDLAPPVFLGCSPIPNSQHTVVKPEIRI